MLALVLSLTAGVLTVGGFAPFNLYPLAIFGVALLFWQWHSATTPRAGFLTGFFFGLGFFGVGISWIYISFHQYGGMAAWLAALLIFLFCAFLALFPASAGALFVRDRKSVV